MNAADPRDVAKAGGTIYDVLFSVPSFVNVHDELLRTVLPFLYESREKRLLVLGPGPLGSPYHKQPKDFKRAFQGQRHKVVLMDYNVENIAQCFVNYHKLGIISPNASDARILLPNQKSLERMLTKTDKVDFRQYALDNKIPLIELLKETGPQTLSADSLANKITFIEHDLRKSLPDMGEFDVVDASYAIHHVANYLQIVQARLNEINAMLRPDGMFHAAEGFCDMTYPEQKIYAIGKALLKANRLDGLIIADNRVPSHPYTVTLIPGKKIAVKEGSTDEDLERQVKIDDNGYVYIPLNLARKCKELKASTLVEIGDYIVMSLIDEAVEEDITNHIKPVADFYRPVNIEIANMQPREGVSAELIRQTVQVDFEEWCNAKRGLVEYYMSEGVWGKLLSGFSSFEVKRPNTDGKGFDGLINIVAYK